jgi:hypothetical protein
MNGEEMVFSICMCAAPFDLEPGVLVGYNRVVSQMLAR